MISGFRPRLYRHSLAKDMHTSFTVIHKETDLWISVRDKEKNKDKEKELKDFMQAGIISLRKQIDRYVHSDQNFLAALEPLCALEGAPQIVKTCCRAGALAEVGPMAAIAGAFAQMIGEKAVERFKLQELVVENGGDIYAVFKEPIIFSVHAGNSPFSGRLGLEIGADLSPLGICTSSGTVGHAKSFGRADAVTVLAKEAAVADAFATRFCNSVKSAADIERVLQEAAAHEMLLGLVVLVGDKVGVRGKVKLVSLA